MRRSSASRWRSRITKLLQTSRWGMAFAHASPVKITIPMKAFFLSYNQALTDRVNKMLDDNGVRGFTRWALTEGRGTYDGEPHYGTHAWPSMNSSILAIVEDEKIPVLLEAMREIDYTTKQQGSRAFVWDITQAM